MTRGAHWAGWFARAAGCLLWGLGALLHLQIFGIFCGLHEVLVDGWAARWRDLPWGSLGGSLALLTVGPVLVAVGAGLCVMGGLMQGHLVAGRIAKRMLLLEWLRYELGAAAFGVLLGAALTLGLGVTSALAPLVIVSAIAQGYLGIRLYGAAWDCGAASAALMGVVREEIAARLLVPHAGGDGRCWP